jgi:hypothetical protein
MKRSIWRFSIGGLLALMTLVAIIVAFATNYPATAWLFASAVALMMLEVSVLLFFARHQLLAKASPFSRHPFLIAGASLFSAGIWLVLSAASIFLLTDPYPYWRRSISAVICVVSALICLMPILLLLRYRNRVDDTQATSDQL